MKEIHFKIFYFRAIFHISIFIFHWGSVLFGMVDASAAQVLGKMFFKYFSAALFWRERVALQLSVKYAKHVPLDPSQVAYLVRLQFWMQFGVQCNA